MSQVSIRPFVCQTRELWQNDINSCSHSYTTWKVVHPSFRTGRMVDWATPSTWNFEPNWPRWSINTDFQSILIARSASAVIPSKKNSIITHRKSTTSFPVSLTRKVYVLPKSPKGALKRKMAAFSQQVHFTLNSLLQGFFMWIYCQWQSCKAFTGLSIRAKMVRGGCPLLRENLAKTDRRHSQMPIFNQYSLVAPRL